MLPALSLILLLSLPFACAIARGIVRVVEVAQ